MSIVRGLRIPRTAADRNGLRTRPAVIQSGRCSHGSEASRSEHRGSEDADLKEREYRDERGNVHHHTRTYMEQHEGERERR